MRHLTPAEVMELHRLVIAQSGGRTGLRDPHGLDLAVARPRMAFDREDLHPTLAEMAPAIGLSIVGNEPFHRRQQAGRPGDAGPDAQRIRDFQPVDEQVRVVLELASGPLGRAGFAEWGRADIVGQPRG